MDNNYTGHAIASAGVSKIATGKTQRGVAAIEFALVFPVFFMLLYGILTYCLIFVAQQSLALAAEEGARAALRYAATPAARGTTACAVATQAVGWLGSANISCTAAVTPTCSVPPAVPAVACVAAGAAYPIKVTVSYPYGTQPLVPFLLGTLMSVAVPATLGSSATVQID